MSTLGAVVITTWLPFQRELRQLQVGEEQGQKRCQVCQCSWSSEHNMQVKWLTSRLVELLPALPQLQLERLPACPLARGGNRCKNRIHRALLLPSPHLQQLLPGAGVLPRR
jgi:hypothetical protein